MRWGGPPQQMYSMVQEAEYQMCYQGDESNPSKSEIRRVQSKKGVMGRE